ncbi:MAG: hypothetical protein ACKVOF_09360 [Pseudohongiellaceae bacterium]
MNSTQTLFIKMIQCLSLCLICGILAFPPNLYAQNSQAFYQQLITSYVNKIENIYDGTWAYTYKIDDKLEQESITRRIDPGLDFLESDTLLAINGKSPSVDRLAAHQKRMQRRLQRRLRNSNNSNLNNREPLSAEESRRRYLEEDGNEKERFLAMLIAESIMLVKQEGPLLYLDFKAEEPEREAIYTHLQGSLILDTENEYIKELQVRSINPFSPFFISRIEDGYLSVRFTLVNGKPMQQSMNWRLSGQLFLVRNMDAEQEVEWTDFSKVPN